MKRRDFLKLIGIAPAVPSVLMAKEYQGTVSNVAVFNEALTAAKIRELRWSSCGYWWDWNKSAWVSIENYSC